MNSLTCPHCDLAIEVRSFDESVRCPSCYNRIEVPRSTHWTMLIVPILAIQQLMLHGF